MFKILRQPYNNLNDGQPNYKPWASYFSCPQHSFYQHRILRDF